MTNFADTVTILGNLGVSVNSSVTVPGAEVQVGDLARTTSDGRIRVIAKEGGSRSWEFGTARGTGYSWGFAIRDVTGAPLDRLHIAYDTGNVGLGVVGASEKLTVVGGNMQLQDTGNNVSRSIGARFTLAYNPNPTTTSNLTVGIRNQNSANYGASVRFSYEGVTYPAPNENSDAYIGFWTMKNGADGGAERMRITALGAVGIGTANPQARLQVGEGSGNSQGLVRLVSSVNNGGHRAWEIGPSPSTGYGFGIRDVDDAPATSLKMVVAFGSGNVGIGTDNPGGKLDVKTSLGPVEAINLISGGTGSGDLPALTWKSQSGVLTMTHWTDAAAGNSRIKSRGFLAFHTGPLDANNRWSGNDERMTILTNGRVGIGATNPQAMLQVGDQLAAPNNVGLIRLASKVGNNARTWAIGPDEDSNMGFGIRDVSPGGAGLLLTVEHTTGRIGIGAAPQPSSRLFVQGPATTQGYAAELSGDLQVTGLIDIGNRKIADSEGCYYA